MDPSHVRSLSVVLPAYRLGGVIAANLKRVLAALDDQPGLEVVVVDDGSDDETHAEAASIASRDDRVVLVRHEENRGKGEALVTGWKSSRGDVVVFLDADLDLPPEQVPGMVALLDDIDVAVGAKRRSMAGGHYPAVRRLLSRVFAASTSGLFGLPVDETQTGLKAFRRRVLDEVLPHVRLRGYAFDLELLTRAHRAGFRMLETPVSLGESAADASLRLRMMVDLGLGTLRLAWWSLTDPRLRGRT